MKKQNPIVYFRDDDIAEFDKNTVDLLEVFIKNNIPLGLSVIPDRLTEASCHYLKKLVKTHPSLLEFYQHGLSHLNHSDSVEIKYEFGKLRTVIQQESDIIMGKKIIKERLSIDKVDVFVPPWHKYENSIFKILSKHNYSFFSAGVWNDVDSTLIRPTPIHLNFSDRDSSSNWYIKSFERIKREFDFYVKKYPIFGFLLHHNEFRTSDDWNVVESLASYLRKEYNVEFKLMTDVYR